MPELTKDKQIDPRNIVAELLRKNCELKELLHYAFQIIEGFIPYKKRTITPPGVEYSEDYVKIRSLVDADSDGYGVRPLGGRSADQ